MKIPLKRLALPLCALLAGWLAACGGSGAEDESAAPSEPPALAYRVSLLAGVPGKPVSDTDPDPAACQDGPALGVALHAAGLLARHPDGRLFFVQRGCGERARIRAFDPQHGTVQTLAVGDEPLGSFIAPVALAVGPDGALYVADSDTFSAGLIVQGTRRGPGRGPGIWRLGPDGQMRAMAGVALNPSAGKEADGVGAQASFGYIDSMCWGADGLLYLIGGSRLRTMDMDGVVSTVDAPGVSHAAVGCGSDGAVLVHRSFSDGRASDYYDPIAQRAVGGMPLAGGTRPSLAYLNASSDPAVLGFDEQRRLMRWSLADGRAQLLAHTLLLDSDVPDLGAEPPRIDLARAVVPHSGGEDFDLLTTGGLLRFARSSAGN
ncbi:MAG: hypothetical protein Q4F13_03910 [Pseudomonadota bacterium]|nr:hypothetical protein [Pseudomonadota bacterium]